MYVNDGHDTAFINNRTISLPKFKKFVDRTIEKFDALKASFNRYLLVGFSSQEKIDFITELKGFFATHVGTLEKYKSLLTDKGVELFDEMVVFCNQSRHKVLSGSKLSDFYKDEKADEFNIIDSENSGDNGSSLQNEIDFEL